MANQQAAHAAFDASAAVRGEVKGMVRLDSVDESQFGAVDVATAVAKRTLDIVVALAALALLLPLMLIIAVAVSLTHAGGALVREPRVGHAGRTFDAIRFRTCSGDRRHRSALGRLLHHTRLDELPQIVNVLLGDLSLVGPHAATPDEAARLAGILRGYGLRHRVRPGLTGWSQVMGDWQHGEAAPRLAYDLYYVRHCSLGLDLRVLARTAFLVLLGRSGR